MISFLNYPVIYPNTMGGKKTVNRYYKDNFDIESIKFDKHFLFYFYFFTILFYITF